ncbi:MAG: phosphatidate cytidylyltransferase [Gammaproteobacteria bacterium]|jgi:phosphatidate cytidylyltransferase
MLKKRILTISILLPLFIWLLLYASQEVFLSATSTVMIIAVFEWLKLLKSNDTLKNLVNIIILFLMFFFVTKAYWADPFVITKIVLLSNVFWVIIFLDILLYSKFTFIERLHFNTIYNYLSCFFALVPCWLSINYMQVYNKSLLLFGCLIIIAADVGAYIFGKLFGKHKLTKISPNKTWEGILGGYLGAILVAIGYIVFCTASVDGKFILRIILLTNVTFMFSVVGDLFESLVKRISGVKDSGNILPGHGGILDRIDSFCSGIPVFLMGVLLYQL